MRVPYSFHPVCPSVCPSTIFSVKDFSATTEGNDLIFGMELYMDELYRVSDFQICRTATSCLPKLGLLFVHNFFCQRFLSFYSREWFDIWYGALYGWVVPCKRFSDLPDNHFLFSETWTSVRPQFFLSKISQLLLKGMIWYLVWSFIWMSCTV